MTHRGPYQPRTFCDSVILWGSRQQSSASPLHRCRAVPTDRRTDGIPASGGIHPARQGFAFTGRKIPPHCRLLVALLERAGSFATRPGHLGSISGSAAGSSPHFSISPSAIWELCSLAKTKHLKMMNQTTPPFQNHDTRLKSHDTLKQDRAMHRRTRTPSENPAYGTPGSMLFYKIGKRFLSFPELKAHSSSTHMMLGWQGGRETPELVIPSNMNSFSSRATCKFFMKTSCFPKQRFIKTKGRGQFLQLSLPAVISGAVGGKRTQKKLWSHGNIQL